MKKACDWIMSGVCLVLGVIIVLFGMLLLKNTVVSLSLQEVESIFSPILLGVIPLVVGLGLLLSAVSRSVKRVRDRQRYP